MQNDKNYPEVIIDEQFKLLLPPLDERTLADLEASILTQGCQIPLVVWNGILIDGYNRYSILSKYNLPFETISMEFPSRDEVEIWIIENQVVRRNLTPMQLSVFRGMHYNAKKRIISNIEGRNQYNEVVRHSDGQPKGLSTAKELSDKYNVSSRTIERDSQVADAVNAIGEISPEIRMDIVSEKTKISRKRLRELATGSSDDIETVIKQIQDGTFENRSSGASSQGGGPASGTGGGIGNTEDMKPWEREFGKMTDEFRQVLRTHAKTDDTTAVRSAIRQYIDMLEELYKNV